MAKGILAILGSGETAPGMTRVHRELLSRLETVRAVNLDSTYGFQLNVPQMTTKLVEYFKVSLQTDLQPLSLTSYEEASGVERELFRQGVREATYVFAGPGSPSYALSQWKPLGLEQDLLEVLENAGSVCFSSAAALTLGSFTAPIYEVYKAGSPLNWLEGLDLMGLIGLNCVVIPHFNNNEGENYDTSCCYLGLQRLEQLEAMLPESTATLGIDEHTALLIDLEAQTLSVTGKGNAYWRISGVSKTLETGTTTSIDQLGGSTTQTSQRIVTKTTVTDATPLELAKIIEHGGEEVLNALTKLVRLASAKAGPSTEQSQLIESLIEIRLNLKATGNYQVADNLRDALLRSGIKIEDTPGGTTWTSSN
jgi:hypothetical protein